MSIILTDVILVEGCCGLTIISLVQFEINCFAFITLIYVQIICIRPHTGKLWILDKLTNNSLLVTLNFLVFLSLSTCAPWGCGGTPPSLWYGSTPLPGLRYTRVCKLCVLFLFDVCRRGARYLCLFNCFFKEIRKCVKEGIIPKS